MTIVDNRFFATFAGTIWVRIDQCVVDVFFAEKSRLIDFVLCAWEKLTGENRKIFDAEEETRKWKIVRTDLDSNGGVVEVRRKEPFS